MQAVIKKKCTSEVGRQWYAAKLAPIREKTAKFWEAIRRLEPITERNPCVSIILGKSRKVSIRASDIHANAFCLLLERDFETRLFALGQFSLLESNFGYPSERFFANALQAVALESRTPQEITEKTYAIMFVWMRIPSYNNS